MVRGWVLARDSKGLARPALMFTADVWSVFLDAVGAGELEKP
nr:DUF397 domain-containing protein [Streptomyces griseoaurantiacus]